MKLILILPFLGFSALLVFILILGLNDCIVQSDAILILGNEVDVSGKPSPRLQARLEKGVQLFQEGYAPIIIVSGGIDTHGNSEAEVMRDYLISKRIPDSIIIIDNSGFDTYASAENCYNLFKKEGWTKVIIVSQYFHLARARLAFSKFGIPFISTSHADYFEGRDLYSLIREVVAFIYYYFRPYPVSP